MKALFTDPQPDYAYDEVSRITIALTPATALAKQLESFKLHRVLPPA